MGHIAIQSQHKKRRKHQENVPDRKQKFNRARTLAEHMPRSPPKKYSLIAAAASQFHLGVVSMSSLLDVLIASAAVSSAGECCCMTGTLSCSGSTLDCRERWSEVTSATHRAVSLPSVGDNLLSLLSLPTVGNRPVADDLEKSSPLVPCSKKYQNKPQNNNISKALWHKLFDNTCA